MATFVDPDTFQALQGFIKIGAVKDDLAQALQDHLGYTPPTPSDSLTNPLGTGNAPTDVAGPTETAAAPPPEAAPDQPPSPDPASALPAPTAPVTAPLVAPPPSPTAPVTAPLQPPAPDANSGMLDRNGVIAYVQQRAKDFGVDPAAALAVANHEGLNTDPGSHWTLPGEGNISFGPPSWYGNGAGSNIIAQHGADAARWSWTPEGIDYWLNQVASAAKGLTGNDAIAAIVHGFERPREDLAPGEIKNAQNDYATFQSPVNGTSSVAPSIGGPDLGLATTVQPTQGATASLSQPSDNQSTSQPDYSTATNPQDVVQTFGGHLQSLLGGAGQAIQTFGQNASQAASQAGDTLQSVKDQFGNDLSQILNGPQTQAFRSNVASGQVDQSLATSGVQLPTNPMEAAGASLGEPTSGEELNAQRNQAIAEGNPLRDVPVVGGATTFAAQAATDPTNLLLAAAPAAKAAEAVAPTVGRVAEDLASSIPSRMSAEARTGAASGADILVSALQKLGLYPEETAKPIQDFASTAVEQGIPKSQVGATIERWMAENPLPAAEEAAPTLEPEVAATLPRGSGPLAEATADQPSTDAVQGLINLAKSRGQDTTDLEQQLASMGEKPAAALPRTAPEPATNGVRPPAGMPTEEPPALRFDPQRNEWVDPQGNVVNLADLGINDTQAARAAVNRAQAITPPVSSTGVAEGLPAGGSRGPWSQVFADEGNALPSAANGLGPTEADAVAALPNTAGVTQDAMQQAYQRIEQHYGTGSPDAEAAQQALDAAVQSGDMRAAINVMAPVNGWQTTATGLIRQVRTGSMAGGITTEGKVALGPIVQVTMRAPVGAVQAILRGSPGDIPRGLVGGIGGLADGSARALQMLKYGTTWDQVLTNGAGGGYGFTPGLDVVGSNAAKRAIGTALTGLVRTHGAAAEISSGIGRGAASALGATPQEAAKVGQQWALRGGQYGSTGEAVTSALNGLRKVNPAFDLVGQVLLPFFRVGYNVFTQGVEHSPVGLAGTAVDVARARLPEALGPTIRGPYASGAVNNAVTPVGQRFARNMFGVGLAGLGLAQAASGNITGEHPTNGNPKWSVRTPLGWVRLNTLGPAGEALSQSAALYEAIRAGNGDVTKIAEQTALSYKDHLGDTTFLRDLADVVGGVQALGTSNPKEAIYQGTSLAQSFIPQFRLGSQVAQALSPKQAPVPAGSVRSVPAPSRSRSFSRTRSRSRP